MPTTAKTKYTSRDPRACERRELMVKLVTGGGLRSMNGGRDVADIPAIILTRASRFVLDRLDRDSLFERSELPGFTSEE